MNLKLIENFVLSNNYYSKKIEYNYIIPRFIINNEGNKIYLDKNREKALLSNNSNFSKKFESDILNMKYIKEFPIIIEDKNLWNNILNQFGINKIDNIRNTYYFLLDFYLIDYCINVEIDSDFHIGKKAYDISRDTYIKIKYGVDTYRFFEYGSTDSNRKEYRNSLNMAIRNINSYRNMWNLYPNTNVNLFNDSISNIVNIFIEENRRALEFIDKIIDYVGFVIFYNERCIKLSYKDIVKLDNSLNIKELKKKGSLDQLFIDGVTLLMLQIYNKKLVIA